MIMNMEIIIGSLSSMLGIILIVFTLFVFRGQDDMISFKVMASCFGTILLIGGMVMTVDNNNKSCIEYLIGNLDVRYEKIYVDSTLIRIDTIITFKNK